MKCKVCKKPLNKGNKYCSLKCYWSISPKFKTKCKNCGKEFYTYNSFVKNGEGFLCSKSCRYEWISNNYKGENSKAGYKNRQITKNCQFCNKEFKVFRSRDNEKRGKFCSKSCYNNWFRDNCCADKAPNWIDGRSFFPYPKEFNDRLKREIKERDKYRCGMCGTTEKLSIHHIDYDKMNNSKQNLLTVCYSCNSKLNAKIYREKQKN